MPRPIIFGEIPEINEGHWFQGRKEMMPSSFHRNWASGIDGNGHEGTAAIVLSGGYEDDQDYGEEIIYTGAGGNDPSSGRQLADQSWNHPGNAGLLKSMDEGLPVRVIRGSKHNSEFSPKQGYLYSGLYSVVDAWQAEGKSGFKVCKYRLVYSGDNTQRTTPEKVEFDFRKGDKKRKSGTVLRIVRETKIAQDIKRLYEFSCQVCGLSIKTKNGHYAEGAHIKPLGKPHDGDDSTDNILCLCPNHHIMLDKGSFSIDDTHQLLGEESGILRTNARHTINRDNLKYHRLCHGYN